MNTLLFDISEVSNATELIVEGERARHIQSVLKLKVGDSLKVGQIDGQLGTASILELGKTSVKLQFNLTESPPPSPKLRVLLALPRPKVLGRKLKSLAELGVKDIHLMNANKVESSYWTAHQLREDQIRNHLLAGLSQSNDTLLPRVHFEKGFRPFVEDKLPGLIQGAKAWVAHPYAEKIIPPTTAQERTVVAIGPEGGWVDFELELFQSVGFFIGKINQRVMSTETAIVSIVTQLTQNIATGPEST